MDVKLVDNNFIKRKYYRLQRKPQNLIGIEMNWLYALVLTGGVIFNQLKAFLLVHVYSSMEPETVFYFWWLGEVVSDHIGKINFAV